MSTKTLTDSLSSMTSKVGGYGFEALITFAIFLTILIISGKILKNINDAACKDDENLLKAHTSVAWTVGLSATGVAISLIVGIIAIVVWAKGKKAIKLE